MSKPSKKLSVVSFLLLLSFATIIWQTFAQIKPLTYTELITALNTKLPNSVFNDKAQLITYLITQIKLRKIDKPLSADREELLREAGATNELIEVIRQNAIVPPTPRTIQGGIVNTKAVNLVKPQYPNEALASGISGIVNVELTYDENGNVTSARAINGHVLLQEAAVNAAKATKFAPTIDNGEKVSVKGIMVYNFVINAKPTLPTFINSIGMEFVQIPAGSFLMGSPISETERDTDELQHQVNITKSFYLGKFEVTQEQWEKVMGNNPSFFKNCPKCPVENVSWENVQDFIRKLNAGGDGKYRLPTEAEWEYACRAGTKSKFSFGEAENLLIENAWFVENSSNKTNEAGKRKPNLWGLFDMHGNVWEWVQDWKGDYSEKSVNDPAGPPNGSEKIGRGGSWNFSAKNLRSANRFYYSPNLRYNYLGFRLVREL